MDFNETKVETKTGNFFLVVSPIGVDQRLSFDEAAIVREHLVNVIDHADKGVICDCKNIENIAPACLRAFLDAAGKAKLRDVKFAVSGLRANIQSMFITGGLDEIVPFYDNPEEAVAALDRG